MRVIKPIVLFTLLTFGTFSHAQTPSQVIDDSELHYYACVTALPVMKFNLVSREPEVDANGDEIGSVATIGARFFLQDVVNDDSGNPQYYVVRFWDYEPILTDVFDEEIAMCSNKLATATKKGKAERCVRLQTKLNNLNTLKSDLQTTASDFNDTYVSAEDNNDFFYIAPRDFDDFHVQKRYYRFLRNIRPNLGSLVVPIKARPKVGSTPFDFTTDFTVGSSIGAKMRLSPTQPHYLSIVGVFGVSTIDVGPETTGGFVTSMTKYSALTPGLGIILEFDGFQIGLVAGKDYLGGNVSNEWIYDGKTWWSFGIGYEFLRERENQE